MKKIHQQIKLRNQEKWLRDDLMESESKCVVGLVGQAQAGKSALKDYLTSIDEAQIKPYISNTTRAMRPGEEAGSDYNFVSQEEARRVVGAGEAIEKLVPIPDSRGVEQYYYFRKPELEGLDEPTIKLIVAVATVAGVEAIREIYRGTRTRVLGVYIVPSQLESGWDQIQADLSQRRPDRISEGRLAADRQDMQRASQLGYSQIANPAGKIEAAKSDLLRVLLDFVAK